MYQLEYLDLEENNTYEEIIKKVVEQCFKEEKLEQSKLYVSITLTTPDNIHKINKQYRDVDRETDVLSFPMFEKEELEKSWLYRWRLVIFFLLLVGIVLTLLSNNVYNLNR